LGRHSKSARVRLPSGATVAAAPAIAGVAAAFCLAPAASASTVATTTTIAIGTAAAIRSAADASAAPLVTAYTVRRGDSLSSIAGHLYHDRAAWPVLYWQNRKRIHWADEIYAGQVLQVPPKPAQIPQPPGALGPIAPTASAASPTAMRVGTTSAGAAGSGYSGGVPGGAFGACVVARESGGNAQVMNATGHYGLYQFSAATWAAYGGNPADFGHASVAEQNQVFARALAAGGQSNWAPYDGC
jgi:LysM repeat protein